MSKSIIIDNLVNDQLYGFRIFPRNLKGQYQTETDGATATATPKDFSLPTYTGSYSIFGNETEGRIEMYTSGELTLSAGTYDIFLVGGGGSGNEGNTSTFFNVGNGGGGGGYTSSKKSIFLDEIFQVQIGEGSDYFNAQGGKTLITQNSLPIVQTQGGNSGKTSEYNVGGSGGDGGSGGGAGGGENSAGFQGKGQGTTTRAFGEPDGTLYAGGGAGGYDTNKPSGNGGSDGGNGTSNSSGNIQSKGGDGGGGDGGSWKKVGQNGTPNTGGGGGGGGGHDRGSHNGGSGGSGIAIIRWKNN